MNNFRDSFFVLIQMTDFNEHGDDHQVMILTYITIFLL